MCHKNGEGQRESTRHVVDRHVNVNSKCDCGAVYGTTAQLVSHVKFAHIIRDYKCDSYGQRIANLIAMQDHCDRCNP